MMKRENIEARGYDTHVGIALAKYKKSAENMKKAEREDQQQSDDSEQEPDDNAPELTHLHPEIEQYQENLPAHDKPKQLIKNIEVVAPTPIIKYNDNGFRPYGNMQNLFKSHDPVRIASGTYDAGKTYSCVAYMDMLARQYPGARLTFIHRTLNRIYENIIPTYDKVSRFPTHKTF